MSADLALAADPSIVERAADPAVFIVQACERAKAWLREALDHGDIEQIVECKSQAEAIRVYTMSKQLGKDAQLSATEIVRRAERGIGIAIRRGQDEGSIRRRGQGGGGAPRSKRPRLDKTLSSPGEFASHAELHGNNGDGIYHMTDGISEEDFEGAIKDARAEGNLSRANVVRRVRKQQDEWIPEPGDNHGQAPVQRRRLIRQWADEGYSSRQMSARLGMRSDKIREIAREIDAKIPADEVIRRTLRHDSNRIVRETVHSLEGIAMGVELVELDDLDPAEIKDWTTSLTDSIRVLSRLNKQMREIIQ